MSTKQNDWIKQTIHFLQHDLWRMDITATSKLRAFGVETLRVIHLVLKNGKEDNCKLHAAALTYATLMALVPFLVILISIGKAIGFTKAEDFMLQYSANNLPEQLQTFTEKLLEMVGSIDPTTLGGIGGVAFLYVIYKMLSGIEESFNQIWGVQSSRAIADKVRNYLSVLVITPSLMLVANTGAATITAFVGKVEWLGPLVTILLQLAPTVVLALAFVAIFMFLPNTRTTFRAALTGAFVSALLIVILQFILISIGKMIFAKFLIYGSLASIPVFIFWMHLNWSILLFGAEVAFAVQNRETYQEEQRAICSNQQAKLWVAYTVMQQAARHFMEEHGGFDTKTFAREHNIPIRLLNEVLQLLVEEELLGVVTIHEIECHTLLHAPEQITAKRIHDLLLNDGSSPEELGLVESGVSQTILQVADKALNGALGNINLRSSFNLETDSEHS